MDFVGIIFDDYTPAVEAQLTRDLISLKYYYQTDITVCCEMLSYIQNVCLSLGIKCISNIEQATAFIIYQTKEEMILPENSGETLIRKLFQEKEETNLVSNPNNKGYYLKEFGRPYLSDINRLQYRPNGLTVDPAIKLLWG